MPLRYAGRLAHGIPNKDEQPAEIPVGEPKLLAINNASGYNVGITEKGGGPEK